MPPRFRQFLSGRLQEFRPRLLLTLPLCSHPYESRGGLTPLTELESLRRGRQYFRPSGIALPVSANARDRKSPTLLSSSSEDFIVFSQSILVP
jgi:hypothetical protein